MGRFFVKRKDYDYLVDELQRLQDDFGVLKVDYKEISDMNFKLANQNKNLKQDNDFLTFSKKRLLDKLKNDNESKNKHIDSLIKENTELNKKVANFKINIFDSIQADIKNRKKFRVRNKQNKKLNQDVVQHLVNIALNK
ncbi:hypothetical protein TPDSL_13800 [Terrisporobacter petrolearius]|uniref:hypothetical protein n=1 Tax=Terrisporobacter petrolearius TaxID=1460447 RepID=UPI0033666631